MAYVFVAVPNRDDRIGAWMVPELLELSRKHTLHYSPVSCSVLTFTFNLLLCSARQTENVDYFIMHHDDITGLPNALTTLVDLYQQHGDTGLLSVVSPIKDPRGITSTGVGHPTEKWHPVKRLTMKEIMKLPETFSAKDIPGHEDGVLMVNTGMMIFKMNQDWVKDLVFTIDDVINVHDGVASPTMMSEDWNMSRFLHERGAQVLATRAIPITHKGHGAFPNNSDWGTLETDDGKL